MSNLTVSQQLIANNSDTKNIKLMQEAQAKLKQLTQKDYLNTCDITFQFLCAEIVKNCSEHLEKKGFIAGAYLTSQVFEKI